jgi:hypothetical protein
MENAAPTPYEAPTITTYGTVRELTLGSGGTSIPDVAPCSLNSKQSNRPSGFLCKTPP